MIIEQIPVGHMDVFCYLIGCEDAGRAMVIDPGGDVDTIIAQAEKHHLTIAYIFNTHNHWDHTQGNDRLKSLTGAQLIIHAEDSESPATADIRLEGDSEFQLGNIQIKFIHTPGHTRGGTCLYTQGQLFTGDTLFVGDSGRTDLPGGDRPTLGASIRRLMKLPDETVVWPGHDYGPTPYSTIGHEKRTNVNAKEYGFFEES